MSTDAEQIAEDIETKYFVEKPDCRDREPVSQAELAALIAARTQPLEDALREALAALKEAKHGAEYEDALGDIIDSAIVKATAALAATAKGASEACPECGCEPPGHKILCKTGNDKAAAYQRKLAAKYHTSK